MSSGYVLILAVLILGGVIATLGDRIGTKVGKARLSLFNLRPKKTAVLVTILTGLMISATTIGVMLLASKEFRDMLLNFDVIQRRLNRTKRDLESTKQGLDKTNSEKTEVEEELAKSRTERQKASQQLAKINESLRSAVDRARTTEQQRNQVLAQRDAIYSQLGRVSSQAESLRSEISRLDSERATLQTQRDEIAQQIAQRDSEIIKRTALLARRDQELADRNKVIASSEGRLKELEQKQSSLQAEVARSEKVALETQELLRNGTAAILRGQILTAAAVKIDDPTQANRVVDSLLREANRIALKRLNPNSPDNSDQQIVQISEIEVKRLTSQLQDGQPYAIRIRSYENYLLGETRGVKVFVDVARNQQIFDRGEILAARIIDRPTQLSAEEIQLWLNQLIAAANAKALSKGLLPDSEISIRAQAIVEIMTQLRQSTQATEVRAIVAEPGFSAGPVKIEFAIVQNGQAILDTLSPAS
jgi:uncharacterized protein (DUF3084 family)